MKKSQGFTCCPFCEPVQLKSDGHTKCLLCRREHHKRKMWYLYIFLKNGNKKSWKVCLREYFLEKSMSLASSLGYSGAGRQRTLLWHKLLLQVFSETLQIQIFAEQYCDHPSTGRRNVIQLLWPPVGEICTTTDLQNPTANGRTGVPRAAHQWVEYVSAQASQEEKMIIRLLCNCQAR